MEIVLIRGHRIVVDASLDAAALDRVVNVLVEMRPAEAHQRSPPATSTARSDARRWSRSPHRDAGYWGKQVHGSPLGLRPHSLQVGIGKGYAPANGLLGGAGGGGFQPLSHLLSTTRVAPFAGFINPTE